MADYQILFTRSARRELEELPADIQERVLPKIRSLAQTPRPPGSKKLRGSFDLWRIRVGDYRILYEIFDRTHSIEISYIRHRRDVYRDL